MPRPAHHPAVLSWRTLLCRMAARVPPDVFELVKDHDANHVWRAWESDARLEVYPQVVDDTLEAHVEGGGESYVLVLRSSEPSESESATWDRYVDAVLEAVRRQLAEAPPKVSWGRVIDETARAIPAAEWNRPQEFVWKSRRGKARIELSAAAAASRAVLVLFVYSDDETLQPEAARRHMELQFGDLGQWRKNVEEVLAVARQRLGVPEPVVRALPAEAGGGSPPPSLPESAPGPSPEAAAPSTKAAYESDWRYFATWAEVAFGLAEEALRPASPELVDAFVVQHLEEGAMSPEVDQEMQRRLAPDGRPIKRTSGPHSFATVTRRISCVRSLHQKAGLADPVDASTRERLRLARLRLRRQGRRRRKRAATQAELAALLATCQGDLQGVRDRALLLVPWSSGVRPSRLLEATVEDLRAGVGGYSLSIPLERRDRGGERFEITVTGAAARTLQRWLEAAGIHDGPLFRNVDRRGRVGKALRPQAVWRIVKRRARLAGLDPDDFGAHSLHPGRQMGLLDP